MSFSWQGYDWTARPSDAGSATSLPGPNHWSDSGINVWIDSNQYLHLAVIFDGTYWRCAEVDNNSILGYGQYQWVVDFSATGEPEEWDSSFLLSLFTYSAFLPRNEIDIWFGLQGNVNTASPGQFMIPPGSPENTLSNFILTGNGPYTCTLVWQAGQLYFSVVDSESAVCGEHLISGTAVPPTGSAVARMSAWLWNGTPPTVNVDIDYGDGLYGDNDYSIRTPMDVTIRSFTFAGGVTHPLAASSAFYAPFTAMSNVALIHRPGPDSPDTLNPVVPINPADAPSYSNYYDVPSLTPGLNARFDGTYSVLVSAAHWDSPESSRYVEVVVTQRDFAGDFINSTKQNHPPLSGNFTPSIDSTHGLLLLGEITLPVNDIPPGNSDAYFSVTPYSNNSSDRFQEVIFIDVKGQTVLILIPGFGYDNYYIEEPDVDRDIGYITGSYATRERAASVLQFAKLSGGPITVDPGSNMLVVYSLPQGPGVSGTYSPRWWADGIDAS